MTPKMQRRLVFDVLSRMPEDLSDPFPDELRDACAFPTGVLPLSKRTFRRRTLRQIGSTRSERRRRSG